MKWEEPPRPEQAGGRRGNAWDEEADILRAHQGEWAVLAEYKLEDGHKGRALVHQIITGRLAVFRPEGEFEAVSRKIDNMVKVFARYVGPGGASETVPDKY